MRKLLCKLGSHRRNILTSEIIKTEVQHFSWKIDLLVSCRCLDCNKILQQRVFTIPDDSIDWIK